MGHGWDGEKRDTNRRLIGVCTIPFTAFTEVLLRSLPEFLDTVVTQVMNSIEFLLRNHYHRRLLKKPISKPGPIYLKHS